MTNHSKINYKKEILLEIKIQEKVYKKKLVKRNLLP